MQFDRALITGASSGLGRALCQLLASKKIPLIITGRDEKKLQETASLLQTSDLIIQPLDLSIDSERKQLIELIHRHSPNLIINNAGFGLYGETIHHSTKESLKMLDVNVKAPVEISIEAANHLVRIEKKGIILNISSAAAFFSFPYMNVYAASKTFLNRFSEALNEELKEKQVRVLVSCPGQIDTAFRKTAAKGFPQKRDRRTLSVEKAALEIWKQIECEIPLYIFDARYRFLIALSHFIPQRILHALLKRSIKKRLPQ